MAEAWEKIRDGLLAAVEGETKDFLDANKAVKAILAERASRLARLSTLYATASEEGRASLENDMAVVRQGMANDISALAVNASASGRATFLAIARVAFDAVIRSLPGIVSIL